MNGTMMVWFDLEASSFSSLTKLLLSVEAETDRAGAKGAMHIGGGLTPSLPPSFTKGQTGLIINLLSHTATLLLELSKV